jgi:RNA polymerase subunit RPABC4/transcription elongation factor Spt4
MENSFKDVLEAFEKLKERFQNSEISRQEFIDEMKRLRIKDDQGHFWMIGAQTGKWYYFDGKDWVQAEPPSQKEMKAICVHCGFETRLDAEVCARCGGTIKESDPACEKCGAKLRKPYLVCPECGSSAIGGEAPAAVEARPKPASVAETDEEPGSRVLRSVKPLSLLLFGGVLGALGGLLLGAFAGGTGYFDAQLGFLPDGLLNFQGTLPRAGIFAVMGAASGFVVVGLIGFLKAFILNLILSIVGGIEYQAGPRGRGRSGKDRKEETGGGTPFGLMK